MFYEDVELYLFVFTSSFMRMIHVTLCAPKINKILHTKAKVTYVYRWRHISISDLKKLFQLRIYIMLNIMFVTFLNLILYLFWP